MTKSRLGSKVSARAAIIEPPQEAQRATGVSVLFETHYLALTRRIAQEVTVTDEGRTVECAGVGAVLDQPEADHTWRLPADTLSIRERTRAATGGVLR